MQGGFVVGELFVAGVTTLDIIIIYVFLQVRGRKIVLALWTALLNMLLPLLGFYLGELSTEFFAGWSVLLSGILLSLIGLHMFLQDSDDQTKILAIHPAVIALFVSMDAFSVSVTLGMLQLNKLVFILASGVFSFVFSLAALYFQKKLGVRSGKRIRQFAGVSLFILGIVSSIQ